MKTIFCPNHDTSNDSINKEVRFLNELGVETYDFSDFKRRPWQLATLSAVNLNWYDDINEESRAKAILILIKKILTILFLKLNRVRIIYTLHNKIAHDGKSPRENLILKKFILGKTDTVAVLSHKSKEYVKSLVDIPDERFFYIGHPAYDSCCPEGARKEKDTLTFLYYGMVRPYKNIEILLRAWQKAELPDARLIIAGKPISEDYRHVVELCARDIRGVTLLLKYIDNRELDNMIRTSDVVVSPLNKCSSMNSGTLVKAMCMKRTIIIPDIEMVYDYDMENMFAYSYDSDEDHEAILADTIKKVCDIYTSNPKRLGEMGANLYSGFMEVNSDAVFRQRLKELYFGESSRHE